MLHVSHAPTPTTPTTNTPSTIFGHRLRGSGRIASEGIAFIGGAGNTRADGVEPARACGIAIGIGVSGGGGGGGAGGTGAGAAVAAAARVNARACRAAAPA